jgi:hypothetical protein
MSIADRAPGEVETVRLMAEAIQRCDREFAAPLRPGGINYGTAHSLAQAALDAARGRSREDTVAEIVEFIRGMRKFEWATIVADEVEARFGAARGEDGP